jgi:DNA repair protein RadC
VVIHNHPSGSLKPSRADKTATEKLVDASQFLNIKLLDRLIISPGRSPEQAPAANISTS